MMFQQEKQRGNNFSSNEDRFNQVTRLNDNGTNYKYNNSRLDEELDISLNQQVRNDIKTNVDFRYTDLENLLALNLGDKPSYEMSDFVSKPP